jgi:hypothetical protein
MIANYTKFTTQVILRHFSAATGARNVFHKQKIKVYKKQQTDKTVLQSKQTINLAEGSQDIVLFHKRDNWLLLLHIRSNGI